MDPSVLQTSSFSTDMFSANDPSQPPRIFGDYNTNGSLQPGPLPPDYLQGSMDGIGVEDHPENGEAKRRRIAKACDACRRKKIKCDGKQPCCSHCENYKTDCVYTHVEKKRAPPKGAKYIEGLENRLGRMENLLKLSGLVSQDEANGTDLRTLEERLARQGHGTSSMSDQSPTTRSISHTLGVDSAGGSPQRSSAQSPNTQVSSLDQNEEQEGSKSPEKEPDVEALSDQMCSLVTNNYGETRYIGASSGFSIFSPKGVTWVGEKIGDDSFQKMVSAVAQDDNKWYDWRHDVFADIFDRTRVPTRPLPPKEECASLVVEFFSGFNQLFPLFHERTFWYLFEKQFTSQPYDGSGWWAALNVVLAIGARIVTMKSLSEGGKFEDGDKRAWAFFKSALAVHTELTLRNTDLLSVQALIGMAIFMQGTPNPQPSFSLLGSAVRLMHATGLHRSSSGFGLNEIETEQRKRVFFVAYIIDQDTSLRSGRPPLLSGNDWSMPLPAEKPSDQVGIVPLSGGKGETVNLFRTLCEFALIASRIYDELYSVKASKQSDGELLATIGSLDSALEAWKEAIPLEFRPEHEPKVDPQILMPIVSIHFAYYNAITTIHRQSIHHGYWSSRLSDFAIKGLNLKPLNPRVYSSAAICVQAARASINLLSYLPAGDFSCVWLVLYYPVSALCTLFANTLQNPRDVRAKADLKLMGVVVSFLSRICMEEDTGSIKRMYQVCKEFERISRAVLTKAEKEMSVRQRRKQEREEQKINDPNDPQNNADSQGRKRSAVDALQVHPPQADGQDSLLPSPLFNSGDTPDFLSNIQYGTGAATGSRAYPGDLLSQSTQEEALPSNALGDSHYNDFSYSLADVQQNGGGGAMPFGNNPGAFQEPFIPPDFWSMPMTFEWDFANVGSENPFSGGSNPFGNV